MSKKSTYPVFLVFEFILMKSTIHFVKKNVSTYIKTLSNIHSSDLWIRLILTKPRIRINQGYKKKKESLRNREERKPLFDEQKRKNIIYIYAWNKDYTVYFTCIFRRSAQAIVSKGDTIVVLRSFLST